MFGAEASRVLNCRLNGAGAGASGVLLALLPITAGATVTYNVTYQPGEISGTFIGNDMNSQPLTVNTVYVSVNDLSNTYAEQLANQKLAQQRGVG